METLSIIVYPVLLIVFGGEVTGNIYFAIQSQRWKSYFDTHDMVHDSSWAYLIFIFLCYSATITSLSFITVVVSVCLPRTSSLERSRKHSSPCCGLLSAATAVVFWVFQLLAAIRVREWWLMFEAAGLADYARQCHALFALALIPWGILALATLTAIVLGVWWLWPTNERICSDNEKPEQMDVEA